MDSVMIEEKVLKLDKSNWLPTKLGDLATEISKRVDNPGESEYDRFVGLGNFVSGDIKIKSWEITEGLSSSAKVFETGDILFARRNAYLRRASMVDFDGCCSGDAFVLRENHDKVVSGFLAFLLNSNALWDYANSNAAGTMSKRVKWRDLAEYKFLLPPKGQQAKLAELLWAMDEVIERENEVLNELEHTYFALIDNLFSKKKENWEYVRLDKIAKINASSLKSKTDPSYEFKYLDLAGIIEPKVIGELKKMKFSEAPSRAKRVVSDNSIILAMVRPYQQAFAYVDEGENIIASTGTAVVDVNDEINSKFIFHQFFSKKFTRYCENRMTGTSYPAITPDDVEQFKIAIPKNENIIISGTNKLEDLDDSIKVIKSKIQSSKALQKSLINQVF